MLENYDEHRARTVEVMKAYRFKEDSPTLKDIYSAASDADPQALKEQANQFAQIMRDQSRLRAMMRAPQRWALHGAYAMIHKSAAPATSTSTATQGRMPRGSFIGNAAKKIESIAMDHFRNGGKLLDLPQTTIKRIGAMFPSFGLGNALSWSKLAVELRQQGNDLVAAVYELRALRLSGGTIQHDLDKTRQTLEKHGFHEESLAADAMFGPYSEQERETRCTAFMDRVYEQHKRNPQRELALLDDRRGTGPFKVSIIVSLYNAQAKLNHFLHALEHQSLWRQGQAELILVDSGSPTNELSVFREFFSRSRLPVVYARSENRETIQSAWNRGINLAQADYLCFLGADETISPDCLATLAGELDADPGLDWVISNSLVASVDKHGTLESDVMLYDRTGYKQDYVYLDTCYLSWVGGLYRRSIHDRFGYYDAAFRAAGDNEFKSRVLPHIRSKAIGRTLGYFWNYPDERMTQHPRAEIEDLRAWYLPRTVGGMRYAMRGRKPQEIEKFICDCLSYRKSFLQRRSSDIELAANLLRLLASIAPTSTLLQLQPSVKNMLQALRACDEVVPRSAAALTSTTHAIRCAHQLHKRAKHLLEPPLGMLGYLLLDNRHEQHVNHWN